MQSFKYDLYLGVGMIRRDKCTLKPKRVLAYGVFIMEDNIMGLYLYKKYLALLIIVLLGLFTYQAHGADTSVAVTATIPSTVEMSVIADLIFGSITMGAVTNTTAAANVYSNTVGSGTYTITFVSLYETGTTFRMRGADNTSFLHYTLTWSDEQNGASAAALSEGTPLTGQNTTSICVAYPCAVANAVLAGTIAADAMDAKIAQAYSDTLTITIAAP